LAQRVHELGALADDTEADELRAEKAASQERVDSLEAAASSSAPSAEADELREANAHLQMQVQALTQSTVTLASGASEMAGTNAELSEKVEALERELQRKNEEVQERIEAEVEMRLASSSQPSSSRDGSVLSDAATAARKTREKLSRRLSFLPTGKRPPEGET